LRIYNQLAVSQIENVMLKTKEEWIIFDRANEERRNSIR